MKSVRKFPQHIIESQQFDPVLVHQLFSLADRLQKKVPQSLEGKIMATLFYEPSTRTRFSFESAMLKLGGNVISTENAREFSSAAKGESLEDTVRVVGSYADVIILRHHEEGAAKRAAAVSEVPIINAGDGAGQHPTQALLDLYTIWRYNKKIEKSRVVFVGDLKYGRTVRSLAYLLGKYPGVTISFVSPPELRVGNDIRAYLKRHRIEFSEPSSLEEAIADADVVYMTRIQKERFKNQKEHKKLEGSYRLTREHADSMKKGAIIMHPLPRVNEISPDVDTSEKAAYFKQVRYGLFLRMAILESILARK